MMLYGKEKGKKKRRKKHLLPTLKKITMSLRCLDSLFYLPVIPKVTFRQKMQGLIERRRGLD